LFSLKKKVCARKIQSGFEIWLRVSLKGTPNLREKRGESFQLQRQEAKTQPAC